MPCRRHEIWQRTEGRCIVYSPLLNLETFHYERGGIAIDPLYSILKLKIKLLFIDLKITLEAKLDLWSPNKPFHLLPWPQKYPSMVSFVNLRFFKFFAILILQHIFLDPLSWKRTSALLVTSRCVFCILKPSKKSQTDLPGGRFTPTMYWTNFRKIGKTEKCSRLILSLTLGK